MGLRVPFAPVPFGFNSPIKFIIYNQLSGYRCIFVLVLRVIWTLFNKVV